MAPAISHAFVGWFGSALLLLVTIISTWYVSRAVYRLTLHPLARFPGPPSRAISHLPHIISAIKGRQPFEIRDLHQRYGGVVRTGPDTLSFITPTSWKEIYGHSASRKFPRFGYARLRPDVHNLLTATGENHARQRSALQHAFSERALLEQESVIVEHLDEVVDALAQKTDRSVVDIARLMEYLAFDIGELALSTNLDCVKNDAYHPWVALLLNFFKSVSYVTNAKAFGPLFLFLMLFAPMADLKKG